MAVFLPTVVCDRKGFMHKVGSIFVAGVLTGLFGACVLGSFVIRPKAAGTGEVQQQYTLKLAHGLDEQHPVHKAMELMRDRVKELSGGKVRIDVYSGGVLGNEVNCLEQVQKGELAMTKVSTAALEAFMPPMKVFSIPFAFRDYDHFWKVLDGSVGRKILMMGINEQFMGLCYYSSGERNFYTTQKPIRSVSDMHGLKVRVMNSRVAMDMIKIMGGSPCPIDWGELYSSLQSGIVDAAENNWPSFVTSRHFEVCKYFICTGHQRIPDMLIISTKVWDTLPSDVQGILKQAAKESEIFQRKLWDAKTTECIAFAKAKGIEIIQPDVESFRKACEPLRHQPDYEATRALFAEIQAVQ